MIEDDFDFMVLECEHQVLKVLARAGVFAESVQEVDVYIACMAAASAQQNLDNLIRVNESLINALDGESESGVSQAILEIRALLVLHAIEYSGAANRLSNVMQ